MFFWKEAIILLSWACLACCTEIKSTSNNTKARGVQARKATTCPCGATKKGKVVGGSRASENEYPWMVSLIRSEGLEPVCGAALLTRWAALTAAHCTDRRVPMSIRAGVSNLANGWGMQGGNKPGTNDLMQADLKVITFNQCKKYHPGLATPKSQMCIKAPGKGGCYGDSGGPVVWNDPETNRYTLVGLVSFGSRNCDPKVPTVTTDVSTFIPWIRDTMHNSGCHKV